MAKTQLGVVEIPRNSNKGKDVEKYLSSIGLGGGYAWCMSFVYWCVEQAAKEYRTANPLYRTGGVLMQWNQRQNLKASKPMAGDIFIMDFGKGTGHCGFVTKVEGSYIFTIEGNTNSAGSRDGDGVYERKRLISSCKGFLRVGT
ncbi:CHAP domain-containing protein [Neisseria sp. Ec49-e6-T10]|uniref:CHAP domain-containing protein n=1 Tax=Neisseria sp. Ec49-e6-T10 TaxID=3140744 RepID=UPI003EBB831C